MGGNFKVKCIKDGGYEGLYTVGKVYECIDGSIELDCVMEEKIEDFEDLIERTSATWELIEDSLEEITESPIINLERKQYILQDTSYDTRLYVELSASELNLVEFLKEQRFLSSDLDIMCLSDKLFVNFK